MINPDLVGNGQEMHYGKKNAICYFFLGGEVVGRGGGWGQERKGFFISFYLLFGLVIFLFNRYLNYYCWQILKR